MRSATTKVLVRQALGLFIWNVLSGVLQGQQCVSVTQVPNQTINSGTSCFSNNDTLNASGVTINGSASVTFVGGRMVHLTPGFRATAGVGAAGTTFHAWVETAPSAVSVSPATGTGPSQQFTWVVSSPLGFANIAQVFPLINTSASGGAGCYIYYNRASNYLFLADDLATTWNGGFAPGSSSSVSNSYCTIYGSGSSVNSSGSQLSLTVQVAFQSATFSGAKNNYLNVIDNQGLYSEYQAMGTWTVANQLVTPNITSVSPTSAVAGTQVTIAGSGFGGTRGAGSIWLGTAIGTVVSWSDTQIIATVAANATSGSARVRQNEAWSNAVMFSVPTATISSVVPASGLPGTQVTIRGTKFGASQASGQVWLGTANAVVQSWSDTQVVAVVASGAGTGTARVLQGGVMSTGVPFAVTSLNITSVSSVSANPGALVTIAGTGFGASQGSGTVLLGSVNGLVVSWSDTQIVAAVALNSVTGVARVQQNGVWSKGVSFSIIGGTIMLTPNLINLAVGETQPIQARGSNGQPVTGLTLEFR